jgi:hypothetical protein
MTGAARQKPLLVRHRTRDADGSSRQVCFDDGQALGGRERRDALEIRGIGA